MNLLKYTFKKLGIDVTFVDDQDDLEAWRAAVRPNTKAFFAETIANPKAIVLDIAGVAGVAHEAGVPLVVDNTIATPYLIRPLEWGADVVIHSATKYLGGHGTSIAGVIVDGGTFDYGKDPEKFPNYNTPEESYHGLVFARDLGVGGGLGANLAYILKARVQLLRDLGSAISPFNAFLIAQGVETLSLRVERHIENARQVAAVPRGAPAGRVGALGVAGQQPEQGARRQVRAQGRRRGARVRDLRRARGRAALRRGPVAAQPRGQHR